VPTRQFGDCALSTGFRNIISLESNVITTTSLAFVSQNSTVQPALGPLGEVYYMAENGALFKIYNGQSRQIFSTGASNKIASPVVSTTGAVVVATDLGQLYRLDSSASVFQFFPINLGDLTGTISITSPPINLLGNIRSAH
jgi:outer membrane protein assembly factor BamB